MRDHRKLRAFELADKMALKAYRSTANFPVEERFGLAQQIRKSAISIPSNIVEGCARKSHADYLRFLDIAFASSRELAYQLTIAARLGYLTENDAGELGSLCEETSKVISGLVRGLQKDGS